MKRAKSIAVLIPVLAGACLSDNEPQRPKLPYTQHYSNAGFEMARRPVQDALPMPDYAARPVYNTTEISTADPAARHGFMQNDTYQQEIFQRRSALNDDKIPPGCSLRDRFDRTETIAYQWGQNRVGFTYDTDGTDFEGAFLRYRLKFQPHQTSKERCRYKSSWQGLVGSGYNELFLRQNNTIWDNIKDLRLDANSRLDTLLQR